MTIRRNDGFSTSRSFNLDTNDTFVFITTNETSFTANGDQDDAGEDRASITATTNGNCLSRDVTGNFTGPAAADKQ